MLQFRKMVWLKNTAKMSGARRAASALLFCAAALALALFPEGAAGGALPGAAPAQIDQEIRVTDYADPEFCRQRGGTVETDDNNQEVCSDVDANDTFCIIGSANAFPCQGLLKHVALCNDDYRRPALNPFFCGQRCEKQIPDSPFPVLARGKKCEQHVTVAGVVLSTLAATIYAAEGFASAAATVEALEGYTLNFAPRPPLEETFAVSLSSGDYVIQTLPPGLRSLATLQLTAEIACATCIREVSLTLAAVFIPVVAPPQSVFAMTPDVALSAEVTFSLPLLESYPGLSNTAFVDADGGDEFDIDAAGQVSGTPARASAATRILRGYWTADGMLGTLVVALTLEDNSDASMLLDAALPPAERVISATAAFGYAGPVGRIVSRTTIVASLLFLPESKDGLSLAADGGVYTANPLDGALETGFGVTVTLLDRARIRGISVSVAVEPVFPPEQDFVIMEVGTSLSGVTFNLPALENYPALSSMQFADADPTDEWTISADGGVAGTLSSTPNTVTIQGWWTADGMLGTLAVDMTLRAGVTIIADEVVPNRTPTLKAAQGFNLLNAHSVPPGSFFASRFVMITTASPDYKLSNPQSPEFQLPVESQRWGLFTKGPPFTVPDPFNNPAGTIWAFIPSAHPIGEPGGANEFGVAMTMDFEVECAICLLNQRISMTVTMAPIFPPEQNPLLAIFDQDPPLNHSLVLPPDYQAAAGRLTLLGVGGGADNLFALSSEGTITGSNPPLGTYTLTAGFSHPDFYGILNMEVTAVISPPLDQCAEANPCDRNGVCSDPDFGVAQTPKQLCTCNSGYFRSEDSGDHEVACQVEIDQCQYSGICGLAACSDPNKQAHNTLDDLCAPCPSGQIQVGNQRGCVPAEGNLTDYESACRALNGVYAMVNIAGRGNVRVCSWSTTQLTDSSGTPRWGYNSGNERERCLIEDNTCPQYLAAVRDCNILGQQPVHTCRGGADNCDDSEIPARCDIVCGEGLVAAGFGCQPPHSPPTRDQCEDNPCHPGANCLDPDQNADNTAAELCTCRTAELYTGNGAVCEAPTIAEKDVNPLEGADVTLVIGYLYTGTVATITSQYRLLRVDSHSIPSRRLSLNGRTGEVRLLSPLADGGALRDRLVIEHPRGFSTVHISLLPMERVEYSYDRASGAAFANVDLASGLLSSATFSPARIGNAAEKRFPTADGYSITPLGVLSKSGTVAAGEVKIGFSAVGPNFLGTLDGEVYVRGNPAAPEFLQFGAGKPISLRGDVVVAENADADGNDLEVMYWGRSRGFHYALVKVGETPDLGGTSSKIYTFPSMGSGGNVKFENQQVLLEFLTGAGIDTYDPGNDPSCSQSGGRMTDVSCTGNFGNFLDVLAALRPNPYNENPGKGYVYRDENGNLIRLTSRKPRARPEPRESAGWTMADYHALCSGRASGVGGGDWRAPSIGEAAALVHQHVSVIVGGSHNKLTQLWTLTNDVSTPITLNALTVNADTVPLLRREFPIGIPGLVPSQLSPPLVQLPAADGGDILGPSLNGAIAVNNGVPAGYVDNQPSDWQGKMWALGVASGGGIGHFSAFTPQGFWRAAPGDITAPLLGGRSAVLSRNERRFFRGATGYAACVAPAGDITPPPELSVMEFSYAGKSVRCPLDATPSALCPEAGHPEVAEIIDSALMDESAAEFIPDENNIVATLTVRAWRFGNRANGAAELKQIFGEAEHAEVAIIGVGATLPNFGVTARKLTSNLSEAVYEVSIARQPPPGVVVSAWLDARPRLGREAKLLMKIRRAAPLLLKDLATLPRRAPDGFAPGATPPGAVRRDLWIGTDYAGPILTINALKAGVSLQIRAVSLDAKISISDAASDGGRVLALTTALPVLGESADTGAFYRSQPDEAAWALLGISADGGAEITLALAAHPLPPRSIDVAVPDEVPGGALVADLMANHAFMRLFPQLFFHAPQQLVEFTDANDADALRFSRKGGVVAAGAGLGAFVECVKVQTPDEPDGEVCSSPFHNGQAEINSSFLRAVRLRTRVQIGKYVPAKNTQELLRVDAGTVGIIREWSGEEWETLWEHYRLAGHSVSISASNTVTVPLRLPVTLIRPRQEDLPDLSASGLEVSVNENGMQIHVPADNTLQVGDRRTVAFSLPIYESKPDGSKSIFLVWHVRLVAATNQEHNFFMANFGWELATDSRDRLVLQSPSTVFYVPGLTPLLDSKLSFPSYFSADHVGAINPLFTFHHTIRRRWPGPLIQLTMTSETPAWDQAAAGVTAIYSLPLSPGGMRAEIQTEHTGTPNLNWFFYLAVHIETPLEPNEVRAGKFRFTLYHDEARARPAEVINVYYRAAGEDAQIWSFPLKTIGARGGLPPPGGLYRSPPPTSILTSSRSRSGGGMRGRPLPPPTHAPATALSTSGNSAPPL